MTPRGRYRIELERQFFGWVPEVYDRHRDHFVLFSIRPSLTRERARRRAARAIVRYERGETFVRYSS